MRWMVAAVVALGLWGLPHAASACEPFDGPWEIWPSVNEAFPANGVVVMWGDNIDPSDYVLVADGQETAIELVDRFSGRDPLFTARTQLGLRATEELPVGSEVELVRCGSECNVLRSWIVSEADHEPPTPMSRAYFDVLSTPECGSSSCILGGDLDFTVLSHVESNQVLEGPHLAVVRLTTSTPSPREPLVYPLTLPWGDIALTLGKPILEGADPNRPLCLEVRVFDQAGNEAPGSRRTCTPCHVLQGPPGSYCASGLIHPPITDEHLFEGSDCEGTVIEPLAPLAPLPPPSEDPETGTDDGATSTSDDGGDTSGGTVDPPEGTTGDEPPLPPPGDDPPASSEDTGSEPAADDGLEVDGCSCRSTMTKAPGWAWLSVLLLVARRRR